MGIDRRIMNKKDYEEFNGIVLSVRKHKEKDALIKIFTLEYGKKMFFIRNYNKANHPMKSALLPFSHSIYIGSIHEDGLSFIQDYKEAERFPAIQEDLYRNAYATYLANLADAAIEDGIPNPSIFQLLLSCYQSMAKELDAETITNIFEVNMLKYFGVYPELAYCRVCGSRQEPFDYSAKYSGVLCQHHFSADPNRLHIDPAAIYFCRIFLQISPDQVSSIKLKPESKQAIRDFIDFFYEEYVGIKLKSKSYIDQMYQWESSFHIPKRSSETIQKGEGEEKDDET